MYKNLNRDKNSKSVWIQKLYNILENYFFRRFPKQFLSV